jgi:hypothetical protein
MDLVISSPEICTYHEASTTTQNHYNIRFSPVVHSLHKTKQIVLLLFPRERKQSVAFSTVLEAEDFIDPF